MTSLRALTTLFRDRLAAEPDHAKPQGQRLLFALSSYQPRGDRTEDYERATILREMDAFERVRRQPA